MRVLIFHGYLLRGTGSNVYNSELARSLAEAGHEVHVVCQDREAAEHDWVDRAGSWHEGRLEVAEVRTGPARSSGGSATVHVPDICDLLPVFVFDRYPGFEVKVFPDLTELELERYLALNVAAVRDVVASMGEPEACLANHAIMGPLILHRAGLRYAAKVHGSDLSYTVGPYPERFVPLAEEGLANAEGVLVGSSYTADQLDRIVPSTLIRSKVRLGPPGLDPTRFRPVRDRPAGAVIRGAARRARAGSDAGGFGRDGVEAAKALDWFAAGEGPHVVYIGKLLVNKGVDLLLAAWPHIHAEVPGARLLFGGFGGFRSELEQLLAGLEAGDEEAVRSVALQAGRAAGGDGPGNLRMLAGHIDRVGTQYWERAREAAGTVAISGRLFHDEVADLLSVSDLLVMPSTFPEAFGMVAAEAAAAGSFPISARHSGMAEVSSRLGRELGAPWDEMLSFDIEGIDPVAELAEKATAWLRSPYSLRAQVQERVSGIASSHWSWSRVGEDVIAAATGRLGQVEAPEHLADGLD